MAAKLDVATLTLQDALDLAVLIEKEAEERYQVFVAQLGGGERGNAADFFAMMSRNEGRHAAKLAKRRKALFGDAPSRVSAEMIEDVEAPGMNKPRPNMSTRHALEVSLESEVKAYDFFNEALQGIKDPEVRKLFEELRAEEAEHQVLVKKCIRYMSRQLPNEEDVEFQLLVSSEKAKFQYLDNMDPLVDPDDVDTPSL